VVDHAHLPPEGTTFYDARLLCMTDDDDSHTDRLLTAREIAERVGVSSETVLRWVRRGEIPAIKLPGGAIRFSAGEFEAWLKARETR
jgi:excisionase family DNA binding protein